MPMNVNVRTRAVISAKIDRLREWVHENGGRRLPHVDRQELKALVKDVADSVESGLLNAHSCQPTNITVLWFVAGLALGAILGVAFE